MGRPGIRRWSSLSLAKAAPTAEWFQSSKLNRALTSFRPMSKCYLMRRMWRGRCYHRFRLPTKKPNLLHTSRLYSVLRAPRVENVRVTCGSSGYITLNIHNNPQRATSRPLIIYLPSLCPGVSTTRTQSPVPSALLSNTVIQINPRWSITHPFPTPIHDTLHAYSWILSNIITAQPLSQTTPHAAPRPVFVYGTGLGGTLATSLALTESRPAQRPSISLLAVQDGIFDWSQIASSSASSGNSGSGFPRDPSDPETESDPDLPRLYGLRSQLFKEPAAAFDAFASPLLFFRTTGLAIPAAFPDSSGPLAEAAQESAFVSRKAHLTFPPTRSGLRIPSTRIAVSRGAGGDSGGSDEGDGKGCGRGGVLSAQAEEMVKLMRRSVVLHEGRERRDGHFDGVLEAERRVGLLELRSVEGKTGDAAWAAEFFEEFSGQE